MNVLKQIHTLHAPVPRGHYSQAIAHQGLVFVAGQLPIDPRSTEHRLGSIEAQAEQALMNGSEILKSAGSDLSHVLKMTLYISDISLWNQVNEVYARIMGSHRPARVVVPVKELHYGYQIEVDAIAAVVE